MMCLQNWLLLAIHIACSYFRSAILQENIARRISLKMVFDKYLVTSTCLRKAYLCSNSCISPTATRCGVYFLHGSRSCLRVFKENVRFWGARCPSPGGVPVVSRWCPSVPNTIFYFHLGVAQVAHVSQSLVCQGGGAVLVWYRVVGWNGCGVVWWCWSVIRSVF